MGKYLKKFETHSQYEAYTADTENFILPNVSICDDVPNEVHYNPYVDPYNGHDYVEIGGLKWATMNIGATNVTDYGLYFQWGDISGYTADQVGSGEGKKYFGLADYKYSDNGTTAMTKYNSTDGLTTLEVSDDAGVANWGGSWRMPTTTEFQALGAAVRAEFTYDYNSTGVAGIVCTDKNDSSKVLFFPAAGACSSGRVVNVGDYGYYWSSSLYSNETFAYGLSFPYSIIWGRNLQRREGHPVRLVVG